MIIFLDDFLTDLPLIFRVINLVPKHFFVLLCKRIITPYAAQRVLFRHYNRNMSTKGSYPNIHQVLIDLCRKGDSKAQFDIYNLYHRAMYNTCLRIVDDAVEAEDIMQEAFFKAFDRINTYRNEVSFGAWLKRIVVNASLDFVKKKKLLHTPLDQVHGLSAFEEEESNTFSPESVEQLNNAITQLPEGYRLVVTLFYLEEYSHEEIAEMLGITSSTSRSQLARAKRRLVEVLKKKM